MNEGLQSIERIYDFDQYLNECAEFFHINATKSDSASSSSEINYMNQDAPLSERVKGIGGLPTNFAGVLQDIRRLLDKMIDGIKTGLKNPNVLYSTDAKDYGG